MSPTDRAARLLAVASGARGQTTVDYVLVIALMVLVVTIAIVAGSTGIFSGLWPKVLDALG